MPGKFLEYIKVGSLAVPVEITLMKSSFYDDDPGTFVTTSKWSQPCHWREIKIMLKPAVELVLDHNDSVSDTISKTNNVSVGQDISFGYVIALNNHKSAFLSLLDVKKKHWTDDEEDEMDLFDNIQDLGGRYKNLSTTKYMIKACAVLKSKSKAEDEKKIRTELGIKADDLAAYLGLSSSSSKCSSAKKRKRAPRPPRKQSTPLKESPSIPIVPRAEVPKSFDFSFTSRTDSRTENFQALLKRVSSSPTKELSAFAKKPTVEESDGWNDCEINGSYYEERDDQVIAGVYCGNVDDDDDGSVISWELPDIDNDLDKTPYFESIPDYLININTLRRGPGSTSSSEISLIDKPKRKKKEKPKVVNKPTESESELHAIYGKATPLAHLGDLIGSPTASPTTTIHSISTINVQSLALAQNQNRVEADKIVNYFASIEKAAEENQTNLATVIRVPAPAPTPPNVPPTNEFDEQLRLERLRKKDMESKKAKEKSQEQDKGRLEGENLREIELEMARLAALGRQKKPRRIGQDSCNEQSVGALSTATLSEIFRASESEGERRSDKQRSPFKKSDIVIQKWVNDSSSNENEAAGLAKNRRDTGECNKKDGTGRVSPIVSTDPTGGQAQVEKSVRKGKENSQAKGPSQSKTSQANKAPEVQANLNKKQTAPVSPVKITKTNVQSLQRPNTQSQSQKEAPVLKTKDKEIGILKKAPLVRSHTEPIIRSPLVTKASRKEILQEKSSENVKSVEFTRRQTRSRSSEAPKTKSLEQRGNEKRTKSVERLRHRKTGDIESDPEMPILMQIRPLEQVDVLFRRESHELPILTPMSSPKVLSTSQPNLSHPVLVEKRNIITNQNSKTRNEYKENQPRKSLRLEPKEIRTIGKKMYSAPSPSKIHPRSENQTLLKSATKSSPIHSILKSHDSTKTIILNRKEDRNKKLPKHAENPIEKSPTASAQTLESTNKYSKKVELLKRKEVEKKDSKPPKRNSTRNKNMEQEKVQKIGRKPFGTENNSKSPVMMKRTENVHRRSNESPVIDKAANQLSKTFENLFKKEMKNREKIKEAKQKTKVKLNLENIRNVVVQMINQKVKLMNESSTDLNDSLLLNRSNLRSSLGKEKEKEKNVEKTIQEKPISEIRPKPSAEKQVNEKLVNKEKTTSITAVEKHTSSEKSNVENIPKTRKSMAAEKMTNPEKRVQKAFFPEPTDKPKVIEKSPAVEKSNKRIPQRKTLVVVKVPPPKMKPGKKIQKAISKVKRELRSQFVSPIKNLPESSSRSHLGHIKEKEKPREKIINKSLKSKRTRTSCEASVQTEPETDSQVSQLSQVCQASQVSSHATIIEEDLKSRHHESSQRSSHDEENGEIALRYGKVYEDDFDVNEFSKMKEPVPMTPETVFGKRKQSIKTSPIDFPSSRESRSPPRSSFNKSPLTIDIDFEDDDEENTEQEKDLFSFEGIESPPRAIEYEHEQEMSSPDKYSEKYSVSEVNHDEYQSVHSESEDEPRPSTSKASSTLAIMPPPFKRPPTRNSNSGTNDSELGENQRALEAIGITENPSQMPAISLLTNQYVLPYIFDCVNRLNKKEISSLEMGRKLGYNLMPPPANPKRGRPSSPDMVAQSSKIVKKMRKEEKEKEMAWSLSKRTKGATAEDDTRARLLKAPYVEEGCGIMFKEIVKRYSSKADAPMRGNTSGEEDLHQMSQGSIACIPFVQRYPQKSSIYKDHLKKIQELDVWDALEIFQEIKDEIIGIFEEKIPSLRHNLFLMGREKLRELKSRKVTFPFGNDVSFRVIDLLYALLIPHPEDRCKWALYIDTVMMPEALIRIYAKVNNIDYKLAENEMRHGPCYDDDDDDHVAISNLPSTSLSLMTPD